MRQGADHTPTRAFVALVATLLAVALFAAPAVAGPARGDVAKRLTSVVTKHCAGLKRKGLKRKHPRRPACDAGRTQADPPADQDSTDRDTAVDGVPGPTAGGGATDSGETPAPAPEATPDQGSTQAPEPGPDPPPTAAGSTVAVVPSCYGLDWKACEETVRRAGFTNYDRAIDPYDNCGCGPGGTWRIIDDFGERIEGRTIPKGAHIIVETNPDG